MRSKRLSQMDRVRRHTSRFAIENIEATIRRNVREYAAESVIGLDRRINELEREWDVERTLEANASTLALTGALLGTTTGNKRWFWLPAAVLTFLLQHATSGWCPPLPILRRLGVRTQAEIDQEKYALKAIRGDFNEGTGERPKVQKIVQSISATEPTVEPQFEPDRIRRYTTRRQLNRIDRAMARRVGLYVGQSPEEIAARIAELRREWSIERYLQINVAAVGLGTIALALTRNRKWGFATCGALGFFLCHAIEGFDPPVPILRQLGVRSRAEIDREIYALKVVRGDFDDVAQATDEEEQVEAALAAVGV